MSQIKREKEFLEKAGKPASALAFIFDFFRKPAHSCAG